MSNVVVINETRPKSVLLDMADRYGMEPAAFEATVRATCIKPDKNGRVASKEEFAAFLLVAKNYDLNPLTKEIYAFPAKGGGVIPIVSVDGWSNLINRHPAADGIEFDDSVDGKGSLLSITCRLYRKDRGRATCATEYMVECKRDTDTWRQWPRRMLRHKAMIQAARYAFGFAGIYDQDEGERIANARDVTHAIEPPAPPPPPEPPAPQEPPEPPAPPPVAAAFDFDGLRKALQACDTIEAMNDAFDKLTHALPDGETLDEAQAILRELAEPLWKDDGA